MSDPTPARRPDRTFLMLWFGQSLSLLGSQVTMLALPLTAALTLGASPAQLGLLRALQTLPFPLVGLFAGVLVDRARHRSVLIGADAGRALLLASIPLAWWLGALGLGQLLLVGLLTGTLRVFFTVAYQAFLPTVTARPRLMEANSRLGLSDSVAEVAGPGLAGALVALVTAPVAIAVDAVSFLLSALSLAAIRAPERSPGAGGARRGLWREAWEGLAVTWREPTLRTIASYSALMNLFFQAIHAIFVLFVTRDLGLSAAVFGAILMASSVGSLLGALWVPRLTRRVGPGPAVLVAGVCYALGALLIPLAKGSALQAAGVLLVAWLSIGVGNGVSNIVSRSLKQLVTPPGLLGRVGASGLAIGWGMAPLGALLGGVLGQTLGLRSALFLAALGTVGGVAWLVCSPLRTLREPPDACRA